MITIRNNEERGHFEHGWLNTYHTFSFGEYFSEDFTQFRSLRVLNEDIVAPSSGFPLHPHRDAEILTYVISGSLTHTDSLGNKEVLSTGDVQYTNAGTGIRHSEFNEDAKEPVHLIQVWLLPDRVRMVPRYTQMHFPAERKVNQLCLLASGEEIPNTIQLSQGTKLYASILESGKMLEYPTDPSRGIWIQLIKGAITVNAITLSAGDGVALEDESTIQLLAQETAEFLLFDLP